MDYCRNVAVSGGPSSGFQPERVLSPSCSQLGSSLDDLFSGHSTENEVGLEWLSMFVEDCLTSTGNCLPPVAIPKSFENKATDPSSAKVLPCSKTLNQERAQQGMAHSLQKIIIRGKARSKIKRGPRAAGAKSKALFAISSQSQSHQYENVKNDPYDPCLQMVSSDPPLLKQTHWLADSELMLPTKEEIISSNLKNEDEVKEAIKMVMGEERVRGKEIRSSGLEVGFGGEGLGQQKQQQQPRRCTHCLSQRTPQWRAGPLGPKTLCNACGVRYKSGRLLPEYRPAKSPTFVTYKHSNSHKKVMEMRMALMSSNS